MDRPGVRAAIRPAWHVAIGPAGPGHREVFRPHRQRCAVEARGHREHERTAREAPLSVTRQGNAVDGRRPHEAGDEQVAGPAVDLVRRAHLLEPPTIHDRDPLAERQRFDLVVGHEDHRRAQAPVQCGDFVARPQAQLRIQVRERFIEQEDAGIPHHGASQGHPLALAP